SRRESHPNPAGPFACSPGSLGTARLLPRPGPLASRRGAHLPERLFARASGHGDPHAAGGAPPEGVSRPGPRLLSGPFLPGDAHRVGGVPRPVSRRGRFARAAGGGASDARVL